MLNSMIYNPLDDYEKKLKAAHSDNVKAYFERLVFESGVDIQANQKTVKEYDSFVLNVSKLKKKLSWYRFWRVLMCISIVLIPLVIWKMTPAIRKLRDDIKHADDKANELLSLAKEQTKPLNDLFCDGSALELIEKTIPNLVFEPCLSVKQELDMKVNYDFCEQEDNNLTTTDVLSGTYNENPFIFENKLVHKMGTETYHGSKTITWTEHYTDSNGKSRTRLRSQTLHASVTKPKPFYSTQVVLNYGSQSAPELCFSRDASHLDKKSEASLERHVKKGEKRLKQLTDKAIKENDDFVSMSNTEFEVLFDALDRTDEVQFRTLFSPLAQTNMVDLILSQSGYGDDFDFYKCKRINKIVSNHSQNRAMNLYAKDYVSHSFDIIKCNFINKNEEFFKAVYFDFAPILAIPSYQEAPVTSLMPLPDYTQLYSYKECEALANMLDVKQVCHPETKTDVILKSKFIKSKDCVDEAVITAYSYDITKQVDVVRVFGGDGRYHNVSVTWDLYTALENSSSYYISTMDLAKEKDIKAVRNGLCIYK